MGRLFHIINASKVFYGTVASSLRRHLSSYYPFQINNSFKKGLYSQWLERVKRAGRSFLYHPISSKIIPVYKSSVLQCDMGECGCPVCEFLQGKYDLTTLLQVIEVLDVKLAESEKNERNLISVISDRRINK